MRRSISIWLTAVVPFVLAACADNAPTSPPARIGATARGASADVSPSSIWADQVEGTTGNGALYALFKPVNWNGDVIYYAHGIIDPALAVTLPTGDDAEAIRNSLGQLGFALAYSSFSETGYDFKDGMQRTHQLRGLVTSRFGKPKRSFLLGQSLGGQIVEALAETYPDQYDGAVAVCGVLGGTRRQIEYIGHIRTVFDLMYPNWLPGTTTQDVPVIPSQQDVVNAALAAMSADGFVGFQKLASINQSLVAGRNGPEMINTLLTALVYHARGVNDFIDRAHGHFPFDNSDTVYSSAVLPLPLMNAINASIARYTSTSDAQAWLEGNYQPTGRLRVPMLTLHNRFDPVVPFSHEAAYQQTTSSAGFSGNLRQRSTNEYGHCNFGAALTTTTVQDLVKWVTTGIPATP
jgi:pimeloyl-ACP methyl ester carboxylesterase